MSATASSSRSATTRASPGSASLLRKYSLDELPQFYNVLAGEMSLVGPRPPLASEVQQYESRRICAGSACLPGITGLWQVEARQDPSFDSYISFDTAYVENWSLWLDFKILSAPWAWFWPAPARRRSHRRS